MNEFKQPSNSPGRDAHGAGPVLTLVYEELRLLAARQLAQEKPGQTLQATALVHEAYLRLGQTGQDRWQNRGHYFAAAAEAMRRILIDRARQKSRLKRGAQFQKIELSDYPEPDNDDRLLALDEVLQKLSEEDAIAAKVVELRQFAGLGHEQIAEALQISVYQARQKWNYAKAWLTDALRG
jgi:RNA polymerase sigma factor (TIGR02999 family)